MGYPDWWDHNRAPRRRNTKKTQPTAAAVEANTKDDTIKTTSTMIATPSNDGKSFYVSTPVSNNTWIIDSGTTNYMTFDSKQVIEIKPSL